MKSDLIPYALRRDKLQPQTLAAFLPPVFEVTLKGGFLSLCARRIATEQPQAGGVPLVVFLIGTDVCLWRVLRNGERYRRSAGIRQGEMLLQGVGGKLPAQA